MSSDSFTFEAIGTRWQIDIGDSSSPQLLTDIQARIAEFDQAYSRFRPDSLVTAMSQKAGKYLLPDDAAQLIDIYQRLYVLTDGKFTPLIGNVLVEAGYDSTYSLQPQTLHKPPTWAKAIQYHHPYMTIKQPVLLDVGAAGKGYLVDIIASLLIDRGIHTFCIDAGGDIVYRTHQSAGLRVGLEHPGDPTKVIGVATIHNQSMCGSATNRRKWANFSHVINPHTLQSPQHIIATWVIADTGLIADALATCLFFISPDKLQADFQFQYVIIYKDYSRKKSPHIPVEFFDNPKTEPS